MQSFFFYINLLKNNKFILNYNNTYDIMQKNLEK